MKYLPINLEKKIVPLKALAEVELKERSYIPLSIIDGKSAQQVFISFRKGKTNEKVNQYKEAISQIEKPEGLTVEYPELNREIKKSFESFKGSLVISIALIFFLILLFFNSSSTLHYLALSFLAKWCFGRPIRRLNSFLTQCLERSS